MLKKNKKAKMKEELLEKKGEIRGEIHQEMEAVQEEVIAKKEGLRLMGGIKAKLIGAFMIPVLLIIILGVTSYEKSSNGIISNYEAATSTSLGTLSKYLSLGFDTVESKATQFSTNDNMMKFFSGIWQNDIIAQIGKRTELETWIFSNMLTEKFMGDIFVIANYSSPISANGKLTKNSYANFMKSEEYKKLKDSGKSSIWLGNHDTIDGESKIKTKETYALSCIKIMNGITTKEIGYVIIDVKPEFIKQALSDCKLPEGSIAALVTGDGREIYPDDEEIPEGFSFTGEGFVEANSENGSRYVKYNGKQYLFLYSKVETGNSYVYALVPKAAITKQAADVKNLTILIVVIATIIAILCGIILASGIGSTIHKINKVLDKTAKGDLTVKAAVKRRDEFRVLGDSINNMIDSMKHLIFQMTGVSLHVSSSAREVEQTSLSLLEATKSITSAVEDIEQGINQQADDAEQCLHQMSALAEQIGSVSQNAEEIDRVAGKTRDTVKKGIDIVGTLGTAAKDTTEITGVVIHDIEELEQKSNSINSIVNTINDIASQTNLLSLNASIEAARAGAAGRGFAVVADEIRKLAEQSSQAAGEIGSIISQIQTQTKRTVINAKKAEDSVNSQETALEDTVQVFEMIQKSVDGLSKNLVTILSGVGEIQRTKDGTLEAIQSISATSQQTAAAATELGVTADNQLHSVEALNTAAEQLGTDSKNLEDAVRIFKIEQQEKEKKEMIVDSTIVEEKKE
ncbi:MAG: methyl-accepting chemotaxis protein [Acetivibrio sp.]